ncbi:MAG: magnesium transporter [bacterium]|nr:magnesium transporter [bacterium]
MEQSFRDIIHLLTFSSRNRMTLFRDVPVCNQGFTLLELSSRVRDAILRELEDHEIRSLLHYLDLDCAARVLRHVHARRRKKIIITLQKDAQEKVLFLLRFSPDTAAGLMDLNYAAVREEDTLQEVLREVQEHEKATGKTPGTVLVLRNGFLAGEFPLHLLGLHSHSRRVADFVHSIPSVMHDTKEKEVLRVFREHPHSKIVVLQDDRSVLGVIYSQDILRLVEKASGESLYGFAGVRKEEDVFDPVAVKVKNRYLWLLINLGTAFLAASVIGLFEGTISRFVFLAAYIPVISSMGGNAGMQTLAVTIRGLAFRKIGFGIGLRIARDEMIAGVFNGLIASVCVTAIAFLWHQNLLLGLIVGLSLIFNLIIAGFFGMIIPLFMSSLGKDPATSASILLTTATDVLGFFVFLGLAKLLLV